METKFQRKILRTWDMWMPATKAYLLMNSIVKEQLTEVDSIGVGKQLGKSVWVFSVVAFFVHSKRPAVQWGAVGSGGKCATHIRYSSRSTMTAFSKVWILFRMSTKEQNNHCRIFMCGDKNYYLLAWRQKVTKPSLMHLTVNHTYVMLMQQPRYCDGNNNQHSRIYWSISVIIHCRTYDTRRLTLDHISIVSVIPGSHFSRDLFNWALQIAFMACFWQASTNHWLEMFIFYR